MRHAAESGAELVRRLMAFARKQELTPTSVDPRRLCESVAGLVEHTLGGRITVEWQVPDEGPAASTSTRRSSSWRWSTC